MTYCLESGCRAVVDGGRCERHQREHDARMNRSKPWLRDPEYRRNRARLLAFATRCAICGGPSRLGDPMTADHVVPAARSLERGELVDNSIGNLRAAHLSCNSRRGADRQPEQVRSMADVYATTRRPRS